MSGWAEKPVHAAVFGSAARGDGGPDSDIDLLLVHQLFPGDEKPQATTTAWVKLLGALAAAVTGTRLLLRFLPNTKAWHVAVDALHGAYSAGRGTPSTRSNCRPGNG